MLLDRDMTKKDLREQSGISTTSLAKLGKGENITTDVLLKICEALNCNITGFKNSVIWNKLYNFQKDAALGIINKLEQYNGCILADSVGLGKTFTALAVIKYYEGRNKNVLVLCPKKLSENWMTYRGKLVLYRAAA